MFWGIVFAMVAFITCIQFTWFQKTCIWTALHCFFKDVQVSNYQSSYNSITVDKISGQNKTIRFSLNNFSLHWKPWELLLKQKLHVQDLKGHFNVVQHGSGKNNTSIISNLSKLTEPTENSKALLGFRHKEDISRRYSFLNALQPPIKMHINQLQLSGEISSDELVIKSLILQLKDIRPDAEGEGQCTAFVSFKTPSDPLFAKFDGKLSVNFDPTGFLQTLRCGGSIHLKNKYTKFHPIKISARVSGTKAATEENLKVEIHYGQANDFILEGRYLKSTDHIMALKWQTICDHSFMQLLYKQPPTLSVLCEGDCYLNRKTLVWDSHNYVSIWAKNFELIDPSLKSLPPLSLKILLDTAFDASHIAIKQASLLLKKKGSSQTFVLARSLQQLNYHYGRGLQVPSEKESQVFELIFQKTPFELFNPYLQPHGYQLHGSLESGSFHVTWDDKEKNWLFSTIQPIRAFLQKATFNKADILSDLRLNMNGSCSLKEDLSQLEHKSDVLLTDSKFTPFFTFSSRRKLCFSKQKLSEEEGGGSLTFNALLAKDCINLAPFHIQISPDLALNADYLWTNNLKTISIQNLSLHAHSASQNTPWLDIQTKQALHLDASLENKHEDGELLSVQAHQCPLDLVQYGDVKFSGSLSYLAKLSVESQVLQWASQSPFKLENGRIFWQKDRGITLKECSGSIEGKYGAKAWDFQLKDLTAVDAGSPLIQGQLQVGNKVNQWTTTGQLTIDLTEICKQPFATPYPGYVGNIQTHWQWDDDKKIANSHINVALMDHPVIADAQVAFVEDLQQTKKLQANLELRKEKRVSDIAIDGTLDAKNSINAQLTSQAIYAIDILDLVGYLQTLKIRHFPSKPVSTADTAGITTAEAIAMRISPSQRNVNNKDSLSLDEKSMMLALSSVKEPGQKQPSKEPHLPESERKWCDFTGNCTGQLKSIYLQQNLVGENLTTTVEMHPAGLTLKNLTGKLLQGEIEANAQYQREKEPLLVCNAKGTNLNLNQLWTHIGSLNGALTSHGQLSGTGDFSLECTLLRNHFPSLRGHLNITAKDGDFEPLTNVSATVQAFLGLTTAVGLLAGGNASGLGKLGFLSSYLQKIPFQVLSLNLQRNEDDKILAQAEGRNADFGVQAQGIFFTDFTLDSWKKQLFQCQLNFSAPETSQLLKYFDFDVQNKDAYGYGKGPQCSIDGTLGKPNYSALKRLILSGDRTSGAEEQTSANTSKPRTTPSSRKARSRGGASPAKALLTSSKK